MLQVRPYDKIALHPEGTFCIFLKFMINWRLKMHLKTNFYHILAILDILYRRKKDGSTIHEYTVQHNILCLTKPEKK